jgi:LEA14-like dessication related protein
MKPLPLIVGGGLLLFYLNRKSKVNAFENMRFILSGAKIGGSFLQPEIILHIIVQNPTDQPISVKSLAGDVLVNNTKVGNISNFTAFQIEPNTETTFDLKSRLSLAGFVTNIVNILDGSAGIAAVVQVKGTVNVESTIVPINLTYKII